MSNMSKREMFKNIFGITAERLEGISGILPDRKGRTPQQMFQDYKSSQDFLNTVTTRQLRMMCLVLAEIYIQENEAAKLEFLLFQSIYECCPNKMILLELARRGSSEIMRVVTRYVE